jgi:hypothetical protein
MSANKGRYRLLPALTDGPTIFPTRRSVIFGAIQVNWLPDAVYTDVDFVDCDLSFCDFSSAEFTNVTFTRCDVSDVYMVHSILSGVTFTGCDLDSLDLTEARLDQVEVTPAVDWEQIYLTRTYLSANSVLPPGYTRNEVPRWAANAGPLPYDPVTFGVYSDKRFAAPSTRDSKSGYLCYNELGYDESTLPNSVAFIFREHPGLTLAQARKLAQALVCT